VNHRPAPRPRTRAPLFIAVALVGCAATASPVATSVPASSSAGPTSIATDWPTPSATDEKPAASPSPSTVAFTAELDIGGGPDLPTEAFGSLWVVALDGPLMDGSPPVVHRIDPADNRILATIEVPGRTCQGIGASPEAVWVCADDALLRIDPTTNEIAATVAVPTPLMVSRLAYGAGTVWAFSTTAVGPDTVVRVDPATNGVVASVPLPSVAGTMSFGHDALWVTSPTSDALLRIDPASNAVETWATGLEGAGVVATGDEAVWVSLHGDPGGAAPSPDAVTLMGLDPTTGDVVAEVVTGGALGIDGGFAVTADAIWLRGPDPFLAVVDPATGSVLRTLDRPGGGGDVAVAFGSVWLTSHDRGTIWRLAPEG
jgi:hypothetical protein